MVVPAVTKIVPIKATGLKVKMDPSDTEEDVSEDEASTTLPAQESPPLPTTPSAAGEEDFSVSDDRSPACPPVMV